MNLIIISGLRDANDPFFNTYRWSKDSFGGGTIVLIDEVENWLKANTPRHEAQYSHYSIYIKFDTKEDAALFTVFWGQ